MRRLFRTLVGGLAISGLTGLLLGGIVVPTVLAGGGCHTAGISDSVASTVLLHGNCFETTVVRIQPGGSVTWTNSDDWDHTVTGAGQSFGTYDEVGSGQSVSYSFEKAGIFPYFCAIHPAMVGVVVVGDGRPSGASTAVGGPVATSAAAPKPSIGTQAAQSSALQAAEGAPAQQRASTAGSSTAGPSTAMPLTLPVVLAAVLAVGLLAAVGGYVLAVAPRRRTSSR